MNNEKKQIERNLTCKFFRHDECDHGIPISKLPVELLVPGNYIDVEVDSDDYTRTVLINTVREETNEEYQTRSQQDENYKRMTKDARRGQYLRLKEEFENE